MSGPEELASIPIAFYLALFVLAAWGGLMAFRGDFWRADQRLNEGTLTPARSPDVAVVIPARNEAPFISRAVVSIRDQDYEGKISVFVVDDGSTDGTADIAAAVAGVTVIAGTETPPGWTGKMWAVCQGVESVRNLVGEVAFIWLTDADIEHDPGELSSLIAGSESEGFDLNSLMVRLRVDTMWDRLLIPAFVFFFQKLYPFGWVNDPARDTAAAAGGSMLVRRDALERIGGIEAIADALIDDCALAARIKSTGGRIRLALATRTRSLRPYGTVGEVWQMVARTAFHQLDYSIVALGGTVLGMAFLYLAPPVLAIGGLAFGEPPTAIAAFAAWFAMGYAFAPTLYRYNLNPWWGFALPVAGALYTIMTLDSARRHWLGRGGGWKGRTYRP